MRLTKHNRRQWLSRVRLLKRALPTAKPVRVRTGRCRSDHAANVADCGDRFVITVDNRLSYEARIDCLLHEYAHCLDDFARHGGDEAKEHGPRFGAWQAACYRAIHGI